jgi:hypothetical protein
MHSSRTGWGRLLTLWLADLRLLTLAAKRTGQQQGAFQSYIQANQALPGGFNQQPSTAAPFYSGGGSEHSSCLDAGV